MHTNAYFFRFCIPIHTHSYPYFQLAPQLAAFPHNAFSSARIQARTHTNANTLQVLLVTILLTSLLASKFSANSRICFLHLKQKKVYSSISHTHCIKFLLLLFCCCSNHQIPVLPLKIY